MSGTEDIDSFVADLTSAPFRVVMRASAVMSKTMQDIKAGARALAPVDTGNLKSSITADVTGSRGTVRGEVGPTANYGRYVENGTSRQRAQPYLRPATDAALPGYESAMAQLGADVITRGQ